MAFYKSRAKPSPLGKNLLYRGRPGVIGLMAGHPVAVTACQVFLLPDGHPFLDLVDDVATGGKSVRPVC